MASPYQTMLGVACAMEELSDHCNNQDAYGQAAIIDALRLRLSELTAPFEWIEDLADSKPDDEAKQARSIARLTAWAEEWRARRF